MRYTLPLMTSLWLSTALTPAFAHDTGEPLLDPAVVVDNNSNSAVRVIVYSDAPKKMHIIKHEQVVKAHSRHQQSKGIDYYAQPDSGSKKDQKNRVIALVYKEKSGQLLTAMQKIVDTYGSGAIQKDKHLILDIDIHPSYSVDMQLKPPATRRLRKY